MKVNMYAVYDAKSGIYTHPICTVNEQTMLRNMAIAKETEKMYQQFPEDFTVFKVGEYDDTTGKITNITPEAITNVAAIGKLEEAA